MPDGPHRFTITFGADGTIDFAVETPDPPALHRRLAHLLGWIIETPSVLKCATGACGEHQPRRSGSTLTFRPRQRRRLLGGP